MSILQERPAFSGLTSLERIVPDPDASREARRAPQMRPVFISVPKGNPEESLVRYLQEALNGLLALHAGWDGHHAKQIEPDAVVGVLSALKRLVQAASARPQFFPLADGGIQAEWLIGGDSIEVEISPDGTASVLATTAAGVTVTDGPLDAAHPEIASETRAFLSKLSARLNKRR